MREIKTLLVYNLVDSKGNKLRLNLGLIKGSIDEYPIDSADKGYRWSFEGHEIPMPIRSGYWFNGFPVSVMLDWLKGNGWALHTVVNMAIGTAQVYELPFSDDSCNGNEEFSFTVESALDHAVRLLWEKGHKLKAASLYRHIKGGTLYEAHEAVKEIVDQQV